MQINKMIIKTIVTISFILLASIFPVTFGIADNKIYKNNSKYDESASINELPFTYLNQKISNEKFIEKSKLLVSTVYGPKLSYEKSSTSYFNSDDKLYINIGFSVCETANKEFIIAGSTGEISLSSTYVNGDIIVVKTNQNGTELWMNTYGEGKVCDGWSVEQTVDSGYIIGGVSVDHSYLSSAMLVKIDEHGNKEWSKKYSILGVAAGTQAIQTSDGGYLITGNTVEMSNPLYASMFIMKVDENGNEVWSRNIQVNDINVGYSLFETTKNNYIVAGYTADFDITNPNLPFKNCDILISKIDSYGSTIWTKTVDLAGDDICSSINPTADSGMILTGSCNSFSSTDSPDLFILKLDESANSEMETILDDKIGKSIEKTDDHGFIIAAYTGGCSSGSCLTSSALIIKTDENGDVTWQKSFEGIEQAVCNMGCLTTDKGYILTGVTLSSDHENFGQIYLLKTDESGVKEWDNTYYMNMPDTQLSITIQNNHVVVENIGNIFAKDVMITLNIEGGLLDKIQRQANLTSDLLMEGENIDIAFPSVFGLGRVEIVSRSYAYNANLNRTEADAFVFLSFLKINE